MHASSTRSGVLRTLRQQLLKSQTSAAGRQVVSTGLPALDAILPENGLPTASVVEWVSECPGLSAATVSLHCAASFLQWPGCLAVVDLRHEFHAAAAEAAGISLSRLLLIRPQEPAEALWSLEQAARCPGVRVVLCWLDRVSLTVLRRLQLAVERSGTSVFLIRPAAVLQQASWADYRLQTGGSGHGTEADQGAEGCLRKDRVISVRVRRSRHAVVHQGCALLKTDYETGAVLATSELADPADSEALAD